MISIVRNPSRAADASYDLIVIGGGIHGVAFSFVAASRGLRPLLLERADFGSATSGSSLRIIHGGFRYLQHADISRFRRSLLEQDWFLRHFPDLVQPAACLLPLYNRGLRRNSTLRTALSINHCLTRLILKRSDDRHPIRRGRVISASEATHLCRDVPVHHLTGAAEWYDALMLNPSRLLMELLRWSCSLGTIALNHVTAQSLLKHGEQTVGVEALDQQDGQIHHFRAPIVVNCAGPGCDGVASAFGQGDQTLRRHSLAFNLVLNRMHSSKHILAINPPRNGSPTYFLVPRHNHIVAGTVHLPRDASTNSATPTHEDVDRFLRDLNLALPALRINHDSIMRIESGILPSQRNSSHRQSKRSLVVDHGHRGGVKGFYSVYGNKYTTARSVAMDVLQRIYGTSVESIQTMTPRPRPANHLDWAHFTANAPASTETLTAGIKYLLHHESALHLDDVIIGRTDWMYDSRLNIDELVTAVCRACGWDCAKRRAELRRLNSALESAGFRCQAVSDQSKTASTSVRGVD